MSGLNVQGTPYYLPSNGGGGRLQDALSEIRDRVDLLRANGTLSASTLRSYYGETRFREIAESNAIEGSPLSVGETELAVLKGVTISGHDPAFSRDARDLHRALERLTELARSKTPVNHTEVGELHALVLGGRPGAGLFRTEEIRISGSNHTPPRSWPEVMTAMEAWSRWSELNPHAPPILRAAVLHAWLAHIHPFIDGNGRTARAVMNLELVRAGYPTIIIRRKDRTVYMEALAESDEGNLSPFLDLLLGRVEDALRELERTATRVGDYDPGMARMRRIQEQRLMVWNAGVHLLVERIREALVETIQDPFIVIDMREYDPLTVDDFIDLCDGRAVRNSWMFKVRFDLPGGRRVERLAWAGFMTDQMRHLLSDNPVDSRPVLFWSEPNPDEYPPWRRVTEGEESGDELTIVGDQWKVRRGSRVESLTPQQLARQIAADLFNRGMPDAGL